MIRGVVVGKFYPLHYGHQLVIDTALSKVDFLTIIVTGKKGQIIPAAVRANWVSKIYPQCKVKLIYHNIPDHGADEMWAKKTIEWAGYKPDMVFTSENYWDNWAKLMGAVPVHVDIGRTRFPISGTKIRKNPLAYLKYFSPAVQRYFLKQAKKNKNYKIEEKIL